MGNQKNIIELNGNRYDASTGTMIIADSTKTVASTLQKSVLGTGSLDGVSRVRRPNSVAIQPARLVHKKPENSKTLMRKSVKKPHNIIKDSGHHQASHSTTVATTNIEKSSKTTVNPVRVARAHDTIKSTLISKFSDALPRTYGIPNLLPLKIAAPPEATAIGKIAARASAQPFQRAIEQATSHNQTPLKKKPIHHRVAKKLHVSPTIISVSSATLAILLIGGFIAYQNVPNLAMRIASTRAGVHASLPGYKPSGFAMAGPIQYKPGQIIISFKSNSDSERKFSITQSTSAWNSETLLQNFVAVKNQAYQTFENNGKTIYIYNGSNATWVDGGIWYNVQGNSSLNSDQLLRIAASI
ncbi:MAG: hypothetical protein NVS1B7_6140 [Candidatus Saccharimonadales bacterium]